MPSIRTSSTTTQPGSDRRVRLAALATALIMAPAGFACAADEPDENPGGADPSVPEDHQQPDDVDVAPPEGEGPNETDGDSGETGIDNSVPTVGGEDDGRPAG